ncbi:MAG: hypothetical protein IPJ73_16455 [Zoogloea sp.]|nr:hypothetical protein [Zoogloea sp.]
MADSPAAWLHQLAVVLATDNRLMLAASAAAEAWRSALPLALQGVVDVHPDALVQPWAAALVDVPEAQPWRMRWPSGKGRSCPALCQPPTMRLSA